MANEHYADPYADAPKELTWDEMYQRLIQAGWKPWEADQEIREMIHESESGM